MRPFVNLVSVCASVHVHVRTRVRLTGTDHFAQPTLIQTKHPSCRSFGVYAIIEVDSDQ